MNFTNGCPKIMTTTSEINSIYTTVRSSTANTQACCQAHTTSVRSLMQYSSNGGSLQPIAVLHVINKSRELNRDILQVFKKAPAERSVCITRQNEPCCPKRAVTRKESCCLFLVLRTRVKDVCDDQQIPSWLNPLKISESTVLSYATRFPKEHCFLEGFQDSSICPSVKSNM